jgi:hypothetical protein
VRPAKVWCAQWHLLKPDRLLATAPDRSFALYIEATTDVCQRISATKYIAVYAIGMGARGRFDH